MAIATFKGDRKQVELTRAKFASYAPHHEGPRQVVAFCNYLLEADIAGLDPHRVAEEIEARSNAIRNAFKGNLDDLSAMLGVAKTLAKRLRCPMSPHKGSSERYGKRFRLSERSASA